jgi:hypothetical protein
MALNHGNVVVSNLVVDVHDVGLLLQNHFLLFRHRRLSNFAASQLSLFAAGLSFIVG